MGASHDLPASRRGQESQASGETRSRGIRLAEMHWFLSVEEAVTN